MSVYFAQVGRYIKVGYSQNPEVRVEKLFQSGTRYARPVDCSLDAPRTLLAVAPGDKSEERACHEALADFAAGCEFFIDEPPVRAFIAEAQAGRYPHVEREAGPFERVTCLTEEDRNKLYDALEHMHERIFVNGEGPSWLHEGTSWSV
jgi:hypothetical protein